jgi:Predicted transcriptional regulators
MKRGNIIASNSVAIGRARLYQNLTMSELAEKTGLSVGLISQIECVSSKAVRPSSAHKICEALGKPFDELFTIESTQRETSQ